MSLLNIKYLRRRRILTLIVILTLTSTLFSITAYSFLGFYNSLTSYIGEGNNIIAIYSTTSQTPFTGIIPLSLENNLTSMQGVISTSTETVTPCIINGQAVFVRGIVPQELSELTPLTMLQGDNLSLTDANSAIIGINIAQELNLKTGDQVLVTGAQSENYVELQIKGIYQSGSSLDNEALVPLYVGQWLRGIDYNLVTLIRVKINPNEINARSNLSRVFKTGNTPST